MEHEQATNQTASSNFQSDARALLDDLTTIQKDLVTFASRTIPTLGTFDPTFQDSASNLLHYLALRQRDLRPLQERLSHMGLSSLGRAEAHVLATVDAVRRMLQAAVGEAWSTPDTLAPVDIKSGRRLLADHTEALLGPELPERHTRIMVTMPGEAADNYTLVHDLVRAGMDCMRINCAHDDATAWKHMIEHLRRAEEATGRQCRVLMDLAGPKLRTGPLEPGPAVIKVRPQRDALGRVTAPARVWLFAQEEPREPITAAAASLPVPQAWLERLAKGNTLRFVDAREKQRELLVVDSTPDGCWATIERTAYLTSGTMLCLADGESEPEATVAIGNLDQTENAIVLRQGDLLILTRSLTPGRPASLDGQGRVLTPAFIGCTLPEIFDFVNAGERVWMDDGKLGGVIEHAEADRLHIRITHARDKGTKLRSDKGINLPDTNLRLPAMPPKDVEDLAFVVEHADMVALSFANRAEDVHQLAEHIERLGKGEPAIVLKVETQRGFDNLPALLLAAMQTLCCGVMIARGDLAVECGYERLAEVQEEILWVCEAAHVPVIWATQVLERLAKQGTPSRAEITDAAMGHRAECVMLNKGPHIVRAVQTLDDILRRMQAHQTKKRSMLRRLGVAHAFKTP
jgi:pyruvate kinase